MARATLIWKIHWPTTCFAAVFLPILISLGFWQLHRAEEKQILQAQFERRREAAPVELSTAAALADYTPVRLRGRFDNEQSCLLDNQIIEGRFGYDVLSPFLLEGSGQAVMVNRGWLIGDPSRRVRPAIDAVDGIVEITGYVHYASRGFQLVDIPAEAGWPKLLQYVDVGEIQRQLGFELKPFVVRIDAGLPGAYRAQWPIINMRPETHIGYAVQWFALALALSLAWLLASSNLWQILRRQRSSEQ